MTRLEADGASGGACKLASFVDAYGMWPPYKTAVK
jgi:hypothetical protein